MDQESELNDFPEKKLVTMRDVARAAGVSVSTVSRVLDERLPTSRSASADKIRQVARELGYRRDYVASSLRRGDTGTLGVLVPRLTDAVTAMLFEEIARAAARRGYFAIVATCGDSKEQEKNAVESLLDRRVDGLIMSTCWTILCRKPCVNGMCPMFWRCAPMGLVLHRSGTMSLAVIWQPDT